MAKRRFTLVLGMVMLALLLLSACNQPPPTPTPQPSTDGGTTNGDANTGGTTTGGTTTGETTGGTTDGSASTGDPIPANILLDPAQAADGVSLQVNDQLYDGLVMLDENGEPVGALAASWVVSDDGLQYTFNLRPGAAFSDGSPVDADAVIANFNRWFDPASSLRGAGAYGAWEAAFLGFRGETNDDNTAKSTFDGIEKVDTLTVIVHLNTPDPDLLTKLAQVPFSIVSLTALESAGEGYGMAGGAVGASGPYMLETWDADSLTLAPNSSYWGEPAASGVSYPIE